MSGLFSKKKTTPEYTKQLPSLTSGQMGLLNSLGSWVQSQVGQGITPYGGELVAGASPLQEEAFGLGAGFSGTNAANQRGIAIQQILSGAPAFQNIAADPYFQEYDTAVSAPALRMFQNTMIPQVLQAYGAGGPSGAVIDALGTAGADLSANLAANRAQFVDTWLGRAAQDRVAGVGLSAEEQMRPIALAASLGDVQRGITNEQLAAEYGRWESAQPWANPVLGFIPSVLGTKAFDTYYRGPQEYREPTLFGSLMQSLKPQSPLQALKG